MKKILFILTIFVSFAAKSQVNIGSDGRVHSSSTGGTVTFTNELITGSDTTTAKNGLAWVNNILYVYYGGKWNTSSLQSAWDSTRAKQWTTWNFNPLLGYTPLNPANNLADVTNITTARTNLNVWGKGDSSSYATAYQDGLKIPLSQKNANNGVAPLDAGGKVPVANLPSSLMIYKGLWDATTNSPSLANGSGTSGWVYQISNSGGDTAMRNWFGIVDTFYNNDWVMYNGSTWEISGDGNNVKSVSVNGSTAQQGVVSITLPNSSVTNAMLAGSIAASKLVGTDITTVGTITSGVWQGTAIADSYISSASTWNGKQSALSGTGIVKSVSGTILYLTDNSGNWNTAYGWGNWASNFGSSAGTIAQGNDSRINNGQTAYSWGNPSGVYLPLSGGTLTGALTINTNTSGLFLNRAATSNYTGLSLNTAGNQYWVVGMRENHTSNNFILYNASTGHDVITGDIGTDAVTLAGALSGTSASFTTAGGTPLTLSSSSTSATYLAMINTSTGGVEWDIASVGTSGNFTINQSGVGTPLTIAKNTGAATFASSVTAGGQITQSTNQNAPTHLLVSNTTSGTNSNAGLSFTSDASAGSIEFGKYSSSNTGYKIVHASDLYLYNGTTNGNISILNDYTSGSIMLAAGGSSTAHLTITSTGAATFASSVTATSFYESSSILKKNVFNRQVSSDGIDIVGFTWKPEFNINKKNHIGVIAQEVEKILPDAVEGDTEVSKRVNYTEVLLYKIAELEKRIKALENK